MNQTTPQTNNPLHGVTLERMLTELVARFGWDRLGTLIDIRCFQNEPSIKSMPKVFAPYAVGTGAGRNLVSARNDLRRQPGMPCQPGV